VCVHGLSHYSLLMTRDTLSSKDNSFIVHSTSENSSKRADQEAK
jgi:hypothetical protein